VVFCVVIIEERKKKDLDESFLRRAAGLALAGVWCGTLHGVSDVRPGGTLLQRSEAPLFLQVFLKSEGLLARVISRNKPNTVRSSNHLFVCYSSICLLLNQSFFKPRRKDTQRVAGCEYCQDLRHGEYG
jgi:hypothetical protein